MGPDRRLGRPFGGPGDARSRRMTWAPASASIMAAKGAGPDPRQLDDLDTVERAASRCVRHRRIVTRVAPLGSSWAPCYRPRAGRVTLIGDHTDYNQGLSLPMAIDLATEATFTPKPGSFLIGVTSDQSPEPWEIPLGGIAPAPPHAALASALSRRPSRPRAAPCRSPAPFPSGPACRRARRSRSPSCWPWAAAGDALELAKLCQSAEGAAGSPVGLLDPLAILGARAGHALSIDFASLESHPVAIPDGAAFVVVHCGAAGQLGSSGYADAGPSAKGRPT